MIRYDSVHLASNRQYTRIILGTDNGKRYLGMLNTMYSDIRLSVKNSKLHYCEFKIVDTNIF